MGRKREREAYSHAQRLIPGKLMGVVGLFVVWTTLIRFKFPTSVELCPITMCCFQLCTNMDVRKMLAVQGSSKALL